MSEKTELWICGQLIGEWIDRGTAWEFQGVFNSEDLAVDACRNESYFIFPAVINEEVPHKSIPASNRARYPLP